MPDTMNRLSPAALSPGSSHTASLVDILDRVLDKGLVVAGDIKISLAEVELLTIRIRLLICSIDKAEQIGMDWWYDKNLSRTLSGAARRGGVEETDPRARAQGRCADEGAPRFAPQGAGRVACRMSWRTIQGGQNAR
jgi:hypothetical protein